MANTVTGRDLLCLPDLQSFPHITQFSKCHISGRIGDHTHLSEFRVGAKWGNVIRYRWKEFQAYADYLLAQDLWNEMQRQVPVWWRGKWRLAPAGATETKVHPDPDPETTSVDGYIEHRVDAGDTWATFQGGAGSTGFPSGGGDSYYTFMYAHGTDADKWRLFGRGAALFDTSSIPDGDGIDSAILSFYGSGKTDILSQSMCLAASAPASDTDLVGGDYDSVDTTEQSTARITIASWSTSAYNDFTLNATGEGNISKTGISKFGNRLSGDLDNTEPTESPGDSPSTNSFAAEETGTTKDPKLVVQHSGVATFVPHTRIF